MRNTLKRWRQNLRGLYTAVHNFWKMRELIWNYVNWDFSSGLRMLLFYLEDYQHHVYTCVHHRGRHRKSLDGHITNLKMVIDESYCKALHTLHDKRWGSLKHRYGKRDKRGYRTFLLYRPKANTKAKEARERLERRIIYKKEELARKQALLQLRRLLGRDIFSFWC